MPNRVFDLLVQINSVGNHDHRIEELLTGITLQPHQLMRKPGDGIGLAGTGGMLDQIPAANAIAFCVRKKRSDDSKLMVARENLLIAFRTGVLVHFFNYLGIILNDVRQRVFLKNMLPEVIRLYSVRIRRITGTIAVAHVEGQKPGFVPLQFGAHPNFTVIHRKMHDAALERKERLGRAAVILILLDRILIILLGQLVFQFHRDDGQAVQKDADIKRQQRIELGVLQLPCNTEYIFRVQGCSIRILCRRTDIKQIQLQMLIAHTFPQQFNHAVRLQLFIQLLEEPIFFQIIVQDAQLRQLFRLRILQEAKQTAFVHGIVFVVFGCNALLIARSVGKAVHDQSLKSVFSDVAWHDCHLGFFFIIAKLGQIE